MKPQTILYRATFLPKSFSWNLTNVQYKAKIYKKSVPPKFKNEASDHLIEVSFCLSVHAKVFLAKVSFWPKCDSATYNTIGQISYLQNGEDPAGYLKMFLNY